MTEPISSHPPDSTEPLSPLPPELIDALRNSTRVVVISGAGISAESGVPTFRGAEGLWRQFRPEQLANAEAFQRDPKLVWEWYHWRRGLVTQCQPNPAHDAVARLDRHFPEFLLITQNVDGLHQRAGAQRQVEIHGSLFRLRCTSNPTHIHPLPPENRDLPPLCPDCGAPARPDIVWFGEYLDSQLIQRAIQALDQCQVLLVIGTSALVNPVASMPFNAQEAGARVAVINLEPSPLFDMADDCILGPAGARMTQLTVALGL